MEGKGYKELFTDLQKVFNNQSLLLKRLQEENTAIIQENESYRRILESIKEMVGKLC